MAVPGSANNGDALTSNAGGSHTPSITYHSNQLFAAWQAIVDGVGIFAARYTSTWEPAGIGSMDGMGYPSTVFMVPAHNWLRRVVCCSLRGHKKF